MNKTKGLDRLCRNRWFLQGVQSGMMRRCLTLSLVMVLSSCGEAARPDAGAELSTHAPTISAVLPSLQAMWTEADGNQLRDIAESIRPLDDSAWADLVAAVQTPP